MTTNNETKQNVIEKAVDFVKAQIFKDFAQEINLNEHEMELLINQKWVEIPTINIPPHLCGMAAPMFKSMSVDIRFGLMKNVYGAWVLMRYHYHYEHPRGSNGYEVEIEERLADYGKDEA